MVHTRPTTGDQIQPLDKGLVLIAEPGLRPEILLPGLGLGASFQDKVKGHALAEKAGARTEFSYVPGH